MARSRSNSPALKSTAYFSTRDGRARTKSRSPISIRTGSKYIGNSNERKKRLSYTSRRSNSNESALDFVTKKSCSPLPVDVPTVYNKELRYRIRDDTREKIDDQRLSSHRR